jgi:Ca2+-binding EF-hand superfamily protein
MKILNWQVNSLGIACGIVFLAVASSAIAQEPGSVKPDATQNRPTTSPGTPSSSPSSAGTALNTLVKEGAAHPDQFTSTDTDKDGKISVSEYTNATMKAFKAMDKDRDGKISGLELTEAQPSASGSPSPLSSAQMSEVDVNKDAQLTSAEVSNGASRMFKNLDVNSDTFLSANELNGRQYKSDTEASADSRKSTAKDSQTGKSK